MVDIHHCEPTSEKREKNFFTDGYKNSRQGCWEGWQLAIQLISLFCGSEHVPSFVICLRSQFHTLGTFYSDTYINVWSHRPATSKPKSGHCPQMTTLRVIMTTPICPPLTPHNNRHTSGVLTGWLSSYCYYKYKWYTKREAVVVQY
jgi:hypothetical protein